MAVLSWRHPHASGNHALLLVTLSLHLLQTHLLSRLPIPDSQVITINPQLPVEEAAEDYAKKLRQVSPRVWPQGGLIHTVVMEQPCRRHCVIVTSKICPPLQGQLANAVPPWTDAFEDLPSERPQPHLWVPEGSPASDTLGAGLGSHILGTVVSPDSWPVR